jgi:hypothetical protein
MRIEIDNIAVRITLLKYLEPGESLVLMIVVRFRVCYFQIDMQVSNFK